MFCYVAFFVLVALFFEQFLIGGGDSRCSFGSGLFSLIVA